MQVTSGLVGLTISGSEGIPENEMEKGLIAFADDIFEHAMQPFPALETRSNINPTRATANGSNGLFFPPGEKIKVSIYKDPYPAIYDGPLDMISMHKMNTKESELEFVAEGLVALREDEDVFVDSVDVNRGYTYESVRVGEK